MQTMQGPPPTTHWNGATFCFELVRFESEWHEGAREKMFISGRGKPTGRSFQMQLAESIKRRVVAESHGSNTPTGAPPKRVPVTPPWLLCATSSHHRQAQQIGSLVCSFTKNQAVKRVIGKCVLGVSFTDDNNTARIQLQKEGLAFLLNVTNNLL